MSKLIHEAHSIELKSIPFKVLFALATYEKEDGIFPKEKRIAEENDLFESQVIAAKKVLRSSGFIDWKLTDRGCRAPVCDYEIKEKAYKAPAGWDSNKHYFMYAQLHKQVPHEYWRFLCLINTLNGWSKINSLRKRLKFWHMGLEKYNRMMDVLSPEIRSESKVASDLIFKKNGKVPDITYLFK